METCGPVSEGSITLSKKPLKNVGGWGRKDKAEANNCFGTEYRKTLKLALAAEKVTVVPHVCQGEITERIREGELTCSAQLLTMEKQTKHWELDQSRDPGTEPIKETAQSPTTLPLS